MFKNIGGTLDPNDPTLVEKKGVEVLQRLQRSAERTISALCTNFLAEVKISFKIVFNNQVNGIVKKVDSTYYVGMYLGTYMLVKDMFNKMLASQNVLKQLGDISLENSEKQLLSTDDTEYRTTFKNGASCRVNDKERAFYTELLTSYAVVFLISHECGHVVRGHLDAFPKRTFDLYDNELENKELLNSQSLEVHADSLATNSAFNQLKYTI